MKKKNIFIKFAEKVACWTGSSTAFVIAVSVIIGWGISGPMFGFSDTWQLVINTGTTIVTFLMVFLIQNTQNRDSHAVQLKLDELIRATNGAHTVLLDLEELDDAELEKIHAHYGAIAGEARKRLKKGLSDTNVPEVILDGDMGLRAKKKKK